MKYNRLIFSTKNQGKLEQVRNLLIINNVEGIDIISEKDVGFLDEVIEDGKTFEENSEKKARTLYNYCIENNINLDNTVIFADDSGLCIDKLDGAPGIYSARFAGEGATDDEKREEIMNVMKEYETTEDRSASFVTVMTGILPNGEKIVSRGECKGSVTKEIGKTFSKLTYNPIFVPAGFEKPISEMNEEEFKLVPHHREMALMGLIRQIL
ncbi:MAG: non-canonical purine NTP pyrophosphatase [Clostridia bacterium]|nr:non-canonical purine NTP pyrophosphatase [Clostridia bacterium]